MTGTSYLARFRAVAKRYPMKNKTAILADVIATTAGEEGKFRLISGLDRTPAYHPWLDRIERPRI